MPAKAESEKPTERAKSRVDFIKRLFAVAVSVGAATPVSRVLSAQSNSDAHTINILSVLSGHWRSLLLLFISLVTVVLSWEGYYGTLEGLPLEDPLRFYLDIAIVFAYLLLMLSTEYYDVWFSLLPCIFGLYLAWDIASIASASHDKRGEAKNNRNMSLLWLICFVCLAITKRPSSNLGFALAAALALTAVITFRRPYFRDGVLIRRLILILLLVVLCVFARWL